jgi:hypothetical protein
MLDLKFSSGLGLGLGLGLGRAGLGLGLVVCGLVYNTGVYILIFMAVSIRTARLLLLLYALAKKD